MKTLKFLLLALSMVTACSDNDTPEEKSELTGTKWKLAALADIQTGESIEPYPKECSKCYTLEFDSDTTAVGRAVANTLGLAVTPSSIKMIGHTKIWEGDNHFELFYDALRTIDTYEYSKDELKIYYAGKKKYLLYKPFSEVELPKLTGTGWQLVNIRNLATGELRTLEPLPPIEPIGNHYEKECFSFTFYNDTVGYGRTCGNAMYVNIKGTNGAYLACMTEVGEVTDDCIYFSDILRLVDECFFKEDQLIFAYTQDNVRYHLQFKQVKE
jgi:hypothetical protein